LNGVQDPQRRLEITDTWVAAQSAHGVDSTEEYYGYEMRTRVGAIALGSTDMSQIAMDVRRVSNVPDGRNVAVFEYTDANGTLRQSAFISDGPDSHSEVQADQYLQRIGVDPANVTRIYTDRQPCIDCTPLVAKYTNAVVTWAVDWPTDRVGKNRATAVLASQIHAYRAAEEEGRLPEYHWRNQFRVAGEEIHEPAPRTAAPRPGAPRPGGSGVEPPQPRPRPPVHLEPHPPILPHSPII
jgi:hypothetical protein